MKKETLPLKQEAVVAVLTLALFLTLFGGGSTAYAQITVPPGFDVEVFATLPDNYRPTTIAFPPEGSAFAAFMYVGSNAEFFSHTGRDDKIWVLHGSASSDAPSRR